MKRCGKCKEAKALTEFHKNKAMQDGLNGYCKPCKAAANVKYWATGAGKEMMRNSRYKWRHSEAGKEVVRQYRASDAGKESMRKGTANHRKRHPEKYKARSAVSNAIASGKLIKPDTCSICWHPGDIQAHHPDYSKPLDVEWLCHHCHIAVHQIEDAA